MPERIRNVYLVLAQKCNLTCSYCYAEGGSFGQENRLMERRTMERALERFVPSAGGTLVVSFFGGEPLLNFALMREAVAYGNRLARELGADLRYALTTNGTVMTEEILGFLKEHVAHVAVSLDGNAAVTDRERRFRNGPRSVHDTVVETIGKLRQAGIRFGIRSTVTETGASELGAAACYLADLGPESVRLAPAFLARGWEPEYFDQLTDSLCALELDALRRIAAGESPSTGEHVFKVLSRALGGERRKHPCAAGMGVVAVAANGDLYPCDHFIGNKSFCMGNVHGAKWPDERFGAVRQRLEDNDVAHRAKCSRCDVQDICGGECPAQSLISQGDIRAASPQHCTLMQRLSGSLLKEVGAITADVATERRLREFVNGP